MIKENMTMKFLSMQIPADLLREFQEINNLEGKKQCRVVWDLIRNYIRSVKTQKQEV